MKLVSDRSAEQIAAEQAASELFWATRRFAANIFRVAAGAGSPHELITQVADVAEAYQALRPFVGNAYPWVPSAPMVEALALVPWRGRLGEHIDKEHIARWEQDGTEDRENLIDDVVQACLRMQAARWLDQKAQESSSRHKLHEAMRELRKARP